MEAVAWSAIGLLAATLFGNLFYSGSRFDGLASRIDNLSARVDAGFARVDARFDVVNSRLDSLNTRLDDHLGDHSSAG